MTNASTVPPRTPVEQPSRAGPRPRSRAGDRDLLILGFVVTAAIALAARHFPYQDGANHLARYVLLDQAWFGTPPPDVHVRLLPTSYIALDLLGVALVRVLGPAAALRAVVLVAVALPPAGMYQLLRRTAPHRTGWALVGVLFGLSWYLLDGLLNFVVGLGLMLLWLAAWWPGRDRASWPRRLALAAAAAALYFVHLSAPLGVLVVVWVDWGLALLAWARAPRAPQPGLGARTLGALVTAAAVFALWLSAEATLGHATIGEALDFRPPLLKLAALGAPFYAFTIPQALVMAGGWAASLAAFVIVNRGDLRVDTMTASAAVFLGLFAVSPRSVGSAGGVDVRWLAPAYLLPFCASDRGRRRPQRPGVRIALLASSVHALTVWTEVRHRDALLDDFDAVLARVPRGARLLPVVADRGVAARVGTYDEYAYWHVIRNGGRVPGLFNLTPPRAGEPPFLHFAHFDLGAPPYVPPFHWGVASFEPLAWDRIERDYDFIVQAGDDPRVGAYLGAHARARERIGAIRLYEVRHPR